jgi:hypothetical protein
MSIGLGIFLAGLSVGLALLLINPVTRRMIKKTILWVVAGLAVVAVSYFFYSKHVEERSNRAEANPSLLNIKLGDPRIDVVYKLGNPTGKSEKGEYFANGSLGVAFDKGVVSSAVASCEASTLNPNLNGISCGDSLRKIENKFKGKLTELCPIGSPTQRIYIAKEFNSMYVLEKNAVVVLALRDGATPDSGNWMTCNAAQYFD